MAWVAAWSIASQMGYLPIVGILARRYGLLWRTAHGMTSGDTSVLGVGPLSPKLIPLMIHLRDLSIECSALERILARNMFGRWIGGAASSSVSWAGASQLFTLDEGTVWVLLERSSAASRPVAKPSAGTPRHEAIQALLSAIAMDYGRAYGFQPRASALVAHVDASLRLPSGCSGYATKESSFIQIDGEIVAAT
eukprot:TRINITY_DN33399_c0_g1_i1.p1 TRINITY_DN33399_c0_g1~~TRINITY_DN33399_c0_g1_i1.p1  ORF type:complete len:202 (-),score=17.02 TRINITY_DN33399_c0_g1_i1:317-898(-)